MPVRKVKYPTWSMCNLSLVPPSTAFYLPTRPACPVVMEGESHESVCKFDYLGCRFTSDRDDVADMLHCMAVAGERLHSVGYIGHGNRLPWAAFA